MIFTSVLMIVFAGAASMLIVVARGRVKSQLAVNTGSNSATAMNSISLDLREAADVSMPSAYQLRIYFPALDANGYYDKFKIDTASYIEYSRANSGGTASATGSYLWRKNQAGAGRPVCSLVSAFTTSRPNRKEVLVTLGMAESIGSINTTVSSNQRLVYLRNQPD
jgi:hypothetical protein